MNDDIRPMTPPSETSDEMRALIMGGVLGCHGATAQPATPVAYPVAPKRPLTQTSTFPVADESAKRPKLSEELWKHAGLMHEYGGLKHYMRMVSGEIAWPRPQPPD